MGGFEVAGFAETYFVRFSFAETRELVFRQALWFDKSFEALGT